MAAGDHGQDATVAYVAVRMRAAGYDVKLEEFDFPGWQENSPAILTRITPAPQVGHDRAGVLDPMLEPGNLSLTAFDQMSDAVAHAVRISSTPG